MHFSSSRLGSIFLASSLFGVSSCARFSGHEETAGPRAGAGRGWRALFDGRGTNGWEMVGPGELRLENGELVTYGGMGMLWYSREKFGHCQIKVVFKMTSDHDNSGVFIRIPRRPLTPFQAVSVLG